MFGLYTQALRFRFKMSTSDLGEIMPRTYYVVHTLGEANADNGILSVCTVPSGWIIDRSKLYYPPPIYSSNVKSYARIHKKPGANWNKFAYIKRHETKSFSDALNFESKRADSGNEETDASIISALQRIQGSIVQPMRML